MIRQSNNGSFQRASTNSHSVIFSDLSKTHFKQEALQRKLKHLHDENSDLQKQIWKQQEDIKDERTVIMYQMGQLAKAVGLKMTVTEDLKIERAMFKGEEKAQETIQQLMYKFEAIQKEQKMVLRVRNALQKMHQTYQDHKDSLRKILEESSHSHQQVEEKMRCSIYDKKNENERVYNENCLKQEKMHEMEARMVEFVQQEGTLQDKQKKLKQQIERQKKVIEEKTQKIKEMDRWEEIIIDKKKRTELYTKLNSQSRVLYKVASDNEEIKMRLTEEKMLSKQIEMLSKQIDKAHRS